MGALTSKPYAFTARPWELVEREAFDMFDITGSSVKLSFRGKEIMRVLPSVRYSLSEEWISDVSRFSYDSVYASSRLKTLTLVSPFPEKALVHTLSSYSQLWFNEFLLFRFSTLKIEDHFCLSHLHTVDFVNRSLGLINSTFPNQDFRFFPYYELSSFYKRFVSGFVDSLFLVDFNLRYSIPTFAIKLRQIVSSRPNFSVFNLGPSFNNLIGDVNLSCSQVIIYDTIRFKNRLSRAISKNSSYTFFSFSFFSFFSDYIKTYFIRNNFSVFFASMNSASNYELGLLPSSSYTSEFGYHPRGLSSNFSTYVSDNTRNLQGAILIPVSHPYEDDCTYFLGDKVYTHSASVLDLSSGHTVGAGLAFPVYYRLFYYPYTVSRFDFAPQFSTFFIKNPSANTLQAFPASSVFNYFTHFFSTQFQINSTNILLNIKRHNEFRSNYVYYL